MAYRGRAAVIAVILAATGFATYLVKYDDWVTIPKMRLQLTNRLKDPNSALFRNETHARGWLCGEFNSKNGYGAYGGFSRFITGSGGTYIESDEFAESGTTADAIALLDEENRILKRLVAQSKLQPDLRVETPSDADLRSQAWRTIFKQKWQEACEARAT
jgi:hypothetical protein